MYKAENIDTDMFLEGIRAKRNAQHEKSIRKKIEADAYFSGYDQAFTKIAPKIFLNRLKRHSHLLSVFQNAVCKKYSNRKRRQKSDHTYRKS